MFGKEPAVVFGGIATLFSLIIPMLVLFNLIHWTNEQIAGLMGVVTFSANFAAVLFTRSQTVPTEVANKQIEIAKAADVSTPTSQIIAQAAKETA